jgi:DNA repair protein RecN (Recombination protein N)
MIGGDEISSVALENASEMVKFADIKKEEIKKNHI